MWAYFGWPLLNLAYVVVLIFGSYAISCAVSGVVTMRRRRRARRARATLILNGCVEHERGRL